jgi:hypothetical protein
MSTNMANQAHIRMIRCIHTTAYTTFNLTANRIKTHSTQHALELCFEGWCHDSAALVAAAVAAD